MPFSSETKQKKKSASARQDPPVVQDPFLQFVPEVLRDIPDIQRAIPRLAKDPEKLRQIEAAVGEVPTQHRFIGGDARLLQGIPDESVHLIVTSPPYWTLNLPVGLSRSIATHPDNSDTSPTIRIFSIHLRKSGTDVIRFSFRGGDWFALSATSVSHDERMRGVIPSFLSTLQFKSNVGSWVLTISHPYSGTKSQMRRTRWRGILPSSANLTSRMPSLKTTSSSFSCNANRGDIDNPRSRPGS